MATQSSVCVQLHLIKSQALESLFNGKDLSLKLDINFLTRRWNIPPVMGMLRLSTQINISYLDKNETGR